ncbi:hypothetical protein TRIATDRAFT_300772 [Trichoderma atroviride IMI 206040]|uniref:Uncharacterized protein n=1 Tax=Hypocrea atroviridis (strain ATCC 20476 / IMI 206040) TaxID=452589 RepID=G9P2D0_HYPAI|nr:uncharacterized protein TRIATDRAFT_300772 [Trichoderma atroviride IMI 206040]EHK42669.1 hypothetical protein TRIATDRAFT_300772 [Trichoderma atroviride IMI 206040]
MDGWGPLSPILCRVASKTSPWQMAIRAPLFSGSGMDKPAILFCLCVHVWMDGCIDL